LTAGLLRKLLIVSGGLLSCEQLPGGVVALGCGGGMPFSSQRVWWFWAGVVGLGLVDRCWLMVAGSAQKNVGVGLRWNRVRRSSRGQGIDL